MPEARSRRCRPTRHTWLRASRTDGPPGAWRCHSRRIESGHDHVLLGLWDPVLERDARHATLEQERGRCPRAPRSRSSGPRRRRVPEPQRLGFVLGFSVAPAHLQRELVAGRVGRRGDPGTCPPGRYGSPSSSPHCDAAGSTRSGARPATRTAPDGRRGRRRRGAVAQIWIAFTSPEPRGIAVRRCVRSSRPSRLASSCRKCP